MLDDILKDLGSRDKTVQQAAIEMARTLSPDELLELAERNKKQFQRRAWKERGSIYSLIVIGFALIGFGLYFSLVHPSRSLFWIVFSLVVLPCYLGMGWEHFAVDIRVRKSLIKALAAQQHPDYIAPALLLLSLPSFSKLSVSKAPLRQMVERLLSQLRPEHAAQWNEAQRSAFLQPLSLMEVTEARNSKQSNDSFAMALAVLEALKRVGDGNEQSKVQTLSRIVVRTEKDRQLQQAAQECLPYLEARAVERKQSQTLLRPSAAQETAAPEILLRPASASPTETPSEQLLRPHSP